MQITETRDNTETKPATITRSKRWSILQVVCLIVLAVSLLLILLSTVLGSLVARILPYLVVPVIGLVSLIADRRARSPLPIIWALGVSLASIALIWRYPSVRVFAIAIPTFALPALALVLGVAGLRRSWGTMRDASPIIALVLVLAILWAPVTAGIGELSATWQTQVTDIQTGGALRTKALDEAYGPDYVTLMHLIQEKTPEDAVIALPDQYTFPITGNPELANYFAYPRVIKSANSARTPVFDISGASYIVGIAENNRNLWPRFAVPVRMYYHAPTRHQVTFGALSIRTGGQTTTIASTALQAWHTDADRSLEKDVTAADEQRTISLVVTGSMTDPWMAPVNLPLANDTILNIPVETNADNNLNLDEQVALLVEVQGSGGETALFTSQPALQDAQPQTLMLNDLYRRASEYAQARGWRPGQLSITQIGLDLGWQIPLSQTRQNSLVAIETGATPLPDGPDSYSRLAHDAQRQILAGNPNAAVDLYAAGLLLRPNNLDGQLALGEAFRAAGQWQEGAQFFNTLLNDHPNDPWIRYSLAQMQRQLGDRMAARLTIGPMVSSVPSVQIIHQGSAKGSRARIMAIQTSRLDSASVAGFTTSVTLQYNTGDGSIGEVYSSLNDGPETLEMTGPSGTRDLPQTMLNATITYRLYGGITHTTVLDGVTIKDLPPPTSARYLPWIYFLAAQLVDEMGDTTTARAVYENIERAYPGPFVAMAKDALARLDGGK